MFYLPLGSNALSGSGPDFDPVNGRSYIRFSFAGDTQVIDKAMTRLEDWLPGLK